MKQTVWLVIGQFSGKLTPGMKTETLITGVFSSKEKADKCCDRLSGEDADSPASKYDWFIKEMKVNSPHW